jgi:sec-independent protein translocase protein TatC
MSDQDTFISHLVELRDRLLRALMAIAIAFALLFFYPGAGAIYDFLAAPLMNALPEGAKMIATGVVTPFLVPVKVTAMVAFLIALPVVLYQAWAFVAPGLYSHEKRLVLPLVVASTGLFLAGVAFCYFFVFGKVFAFINQFAPKSITPAPDIEAYLGFVLTMFVAFGVTFEIPVVVVVLARFGIVTIEQLKQARPYVVVGAFVVAAIVTPPDVVSQLMLAIPMCILYEVGLVVARVITPRETAVAGSALMESAEESRRGE